MVSEGGLDGRFAMDPFVKNEKAKFGLMWKSALNAFTYCARPRAIVPQILWHRDGSKTNAPILEELRWGSPLEYTLEQMRNPVDGSRMFASGRTLRQRAEDIMHMFRSGCACLSIDLSSFDGSQASLAVAERAAFLDFWTNTKGCDTTELKKVLRAQNLFNFSTKGLKGQVFGNRASGTGRTSSGNKVVMIAALRYAFRNAPDVSFYCDGDDTLIFIPTYKLQRRIRNFVRRMDQLGLETKVEGIAYEPYDVVFCRAQIVELEDGPILVKNPFDAVTGMSCITKHFKGPEFAAYLSSVSTSYKFVYAGVPILGALHKIYPSDGTFRSSLLDSWDVAFYRNNKTDKVTPHVSSIARTSFYRTFGITPQLQMEIEELIGAIGAGMPTALSERSHIAR